MPLQPLNTDDFWKVNINWSRPIKYENIIKSQCCYDDDAHLYHILGRYSGHKYKSLYIGHTYNQCISTRLRQPDHKARYDQFRLNMPNHQFWVSCGIVEVANGKKVRKRIKEIETILIYTNQSEHAHNVSNVYAHGITGSYYIQNNGYRFDLPKELHLGFFAR